LPLAIFDSGVGGLTVVAAVKRALPNEAIMYLGDTARLPYGTKSPEVVERYALACGRFLQARGAKLLVVACNTATAHALPHLQQTMPIPVLGVIEPGAILAARTSVGGRIGVLGTEGTIESGSYQRALARLAPAATVLTASCPMFVPLAEEGMLRHPATELIAREYLAPLLAQNIDTLVLGCTHYPLLRPLLAHICGPQVTIIDSAQAVALAIAEVLQAQQLQSPSKRTRLDDRFFATDVSRRLHRVGSAFLGQSMASVELVDIAVTA
jgi:glutamate racemase